MRKLVPALALSTAVFASTTVYYAHQLSVEREWAASRASQLLAATGPSTKRVSPTAVATRPAAKAVPAPVTQDATAFISGTVNTAPADEAEMKRMQAEYARTLLAQLSDPERREELLAEYKMMMRNSYPRVDLVLGLTPAEHARFLELSAQEQIDMQEANARCMVDSSCRTQDFRLDGMGSRQQAITELLGPERAQRFETYKNTMGEREAVAQLRNRLPDALRISDDKAESLIAALAEERDLIHRQVSQTGGARGINMGVGMVFAPGEGGGYEEQYEFARQSSQRLRDRAAQYLNAEQLHAFNEMQDETLLSLRGVLRNKDAIAEGVSAVAADDSK